MGITSNLYLAVAVLLVAAGSLSLASFLDYSLDSYPSRKASPGELEAMWAWASSPNPQVDVRFEGVERSDPGGVTVERLSFSLYPGMYDCRVAAWRYYTEGSTSSWVVLVHGLGGDHRFFEEIDGLNLPYYLAGLGLNVLSIDAAGHGDSCIPGGSSWKDKVEVGEPSDFFLAHVYASAVRAVQAARLLGAESVAVMGVSMGGMASYVALALGPADMAIPVAAAGCIGCMIASGGLANLLGDPEAELTEELLDFYSLVDPLSYIDVYQRSLYGKPVIIAYSTHDEYFPLESLEATIDSLRAAGARVYLSLAPNNNHFTPADVWMFLVDRVFRAYADGGPPLVEAELTLDPPRRLDAWLGLPWRLPADGLAFTAVPVASIVMPLEAVDPYSESPFQPYRDDRVAALAFAGGLYSAGIMLASTARGWRTSLIAGLGTAAYATLMTLPYYRWPERFSLSLLETLDRYGATLAGETGIPALHLATAAIALAPIALQASVLASGSRMKAALALLFLMLALAPYALARITVNAILEEAGVVVPAGFYPLEIALPALPLSLSILARLASLPRSRGPTVEWMGFKVRV